MMFHLVLVMVRYCIQNNLIFTKYQIKDLLKSKILESLSNDDDDPEDSAW